MKDKIKCQICGKEFKQIQHRHLKQHGLTIDQYKENFPDAPIISESSSAKRRKAAIGREIAWADKISESVKKSWENNKFQGRTGVPLDEESRKRLSQKMMGHSVSEETRIKIGLAGIGRTPWNKGLTKEDDERLLSVSEKIRQWNTEHMTPEVKLQISETLKRKYADGMPIPQSKGNMRADLNMYFRSTWEANYARILNYENTCWLYEPRAFALYDSVGDIIAVYTPDFFTDKWIEVKGHARAANNWECECSRCERDKMKMLLFTEQYPNEEIEMICKKEYRELSRQYSKVIAHWECTSYDP